MDLSDRMANSSTLSCESEFLSRRRRLIKRILLSIYDYGSNKRNPFELSGHCQSFSRFHQITRSLAGALQRIAKLIVDSRPFFLIPVYIPLTIRPRECRKNH